MTPNKLVAVCALFLCAVTATWMLSEESLDNHECLVSVTTREMLASGDWLMPTCNSETRLQKTPLNYWLVGGLAKITGEIDEFTARLPSAVFAFLSAAAILFFVNRWLSFRIAVLSACVWATTLCYYNYSHNARPEMSLTFFIVLCFLSFYSAITAQTRRSQIVYMLIFWISFALGNLAKGPAPLPLVMVPLFFYVLLYKHWRLVPKLLPITGSIIFLAILLPWPLFIAHRVNWDLIVWKQQFFDRFVGTYAKGKYPFFFYFLIMFRYITPWVAFLPMALAAPFYKVWAEKQPVMKFLFIWFVADLIFLTIDAGKRQHYILPSMPAMAILIGILLEDMIFSRKAFTHEFAVKVLKGHLAVTVVGIVIATACIAVISPPNLNKMLALTMVTAAAAAAVAVLFAKRKTGWGCAAIFAGVLVWVMISYAEFASVRDEFKYSRDFSKKASQIVPPTENLIAYKHISSGFVHYFGRTVPVISDANELYNRYQNGDWIAAASSRSLKELTQDNRLREVYHKAKSASQKEDQDRALFHISAPVVKAE